MFAFLEVACRRVSSSVHPPCPPDIPSLGARKFYANGLTQGAIDPLRREQNAAMRRLFGGRSEIQTDDCRHLAGKCPSARARPKETRLAVGIRVIES